MARKILLADDSVTAQNMGRKILADAGYDVVTVNNGSAALKRIAEIKPDLIVLDVYMPGYSGLEVCQRLKDAAETAHIPVLLTVGKLEPFKAEEGRRVRADHHIVKPFEASELLTAITRLEDRIVPQHSAAADRFNGKANRTADRASDRSSESNTDADTGWKSRLSFSKKKKDEKEPAREEVGSGANFRDFRKTKGKSAVSETLKPQTKPAAEPQAEPVPNAMPEVPRDITPEELDALSALASKLNASSLEPEPAQMEEAIEAASETKEIDTPEEKIEVSPQTIDASDQTSEQIGETPSQTIEASSDQTTEAIASTMSPLAFAAGSWESAAKAELEIPVHYVETATESAVTEAVSSESYQSAALQSEEAYREAQAPEVPVLMEVNMALLAEQPSPVDREDEPSFASSAASFANAVEPAAEEEKKEEVKIEAGEAVAANAVSEASAPEAIAPEYQEVQPQLATEATEESKAEETSRHDSAAAIQREAENAAPSDAELVEALRLLTPATPFSDFVPPRETLAAAGQLLAEQAVLNAASGPRWVAEPMMLSPEEAAISLETEMMLTLASVPVSALAREVDTEVIGVSAITAAVENRLAHMAETARNEDSAVRDSDAHKALESSQAERVSQVDVVEVAAAVAVETPVSAMPAVESRSVESHNVELPVETIAACDSSNRAEDQTEKLDAPATTIEETPKAMAAAAAENSAFASATDASTIASIVDSVMADLRPRILEEIARKLAKRD